MGLNADIEQLLKIGN